VNKQLQQLYSNHSYWLSTKYLTKIKILELRKSQDKTLVYSFIALTYLRWPVFGLSWMKSEVNPTAIHVGFVVDKAKNGQAFLRLYSQVKFSPSENLRIQCQETQPEPIIMALVK
jgi:hypothetical protein